MEAYNKEKAIWDSEVDRQSTIKKAFAQHALAEFAPFWENFSKGLDIGSLYNAHGIMFRIPIKRDSDGVFIEVGEAEVLLQDKVVVLKPSGAKAATPSTTTPTSRGSSMQVKMKDGSLVTYPSAAAAHRALLQNGKNDGKQRATPVIVSALEKAGYMVLSS